MGSLQQQPDHCAAGGDDYVGESTGVDKVYRRILPWLCTVAAICYIDRINLAFASFSMTRDLNFSPSVYGTGSGLFFAGYCLAMIPSQLIGLRVGVSRWLGVIVCLWGMVAVCFAAMETPAHFFVLRVMLGMAEAGTFPAIWYYLYIMLPKEALTFPYSALEASVHTANILSAPLAAILLLLEGVFGLAGWQWLFVCEGTTTLIIGAATGLLLPATLQHANFLSSTERRSIQQQQCRQQGSQSDASGFSNWHVLRQACKNKRVWYISCMGILKNMAADGILFWLPIIVAGLFPSSESMGSPDLMAAGAPGGRIPEAAEDALMGGLDDPLPSGPDDSHPSAGPSGISLPVLLSSIPFVATTLFTLWLGRSSQATGERAMHLTIPYVTAGVMLALLPYLRALSGVVAFVAVCITVACTLGSNCIINAYIPAVTSPDSVSVALPLYNSVANLGGIMGPIVIGFVVEVTGSYDAAMQLLGLLMLSAALMAYFTRRWDVDDSRSSGGSRPSGVVSKEHLRSRQELSQAAAVMDDSSSPGANDAESADKQRLLPS